MKQSSQDTRMAMIICIKKKETNITFFTHTVASAIGCPENWTGTNKPGQMTTRRSSVLDYRPYVSPQGKLLSNASFQMGKTTMAADVAMYPATWWDRFQGELYESHYYFIIGLLKV